MRYPPTSEQPVAVTQRSSACYRHWPFRCCSGPGAYPRLTPALTRPVRWDLVADNYDQLIRYATAIREGTASTEAVLSRFTRSATHPAYQAMLEIGRAQRTIFVARYLRDRDLQREIEEGLNVVEAWNGANAVICYGRGGEISTNRHEEVEMTTLCLRILQAAPSRVSSCSTSARDSARTRSGRGLRRRSIRDGSAGIQPCRCQ
jgi:TnpA family transposase